MTDDTEATARPATRAMLDHALAYAARGWHVFPCKPRGKTPITAHGVKDATDNLDQVRAWWTATPDANIGLATGGASSVIVIDIDGRDAEERYGLMLHTHGAPGTATCPDGASVRTGNGWHLYLAPPRGLTIRNSASKLAQGIDIRGDGGYVIAPPSVHPSGRRYTWRDPVPDTGLPALAGAWARMLMPKPPAAPKRRHTPAEPGAAGTPYGLAALTSECEAVAATGEGGRNHRLNEAAFNAGTLIAAGELDLAHAIDQLAAAADTAGLPPNEAEKTIASGLRAGRKKPRDRAA